MMKKNTTGASASRIDAAIAIAAKTGSSTSPCRRSAPVTSPAIQPKPGTNSVEAMKTMGNFTATQEAIDGERHAAMRTMDRRSNDDPSALLTHLVDADVAAVACTFRILARRQTPMKQQPPKQRRFA